jgi:DNA-directed RNA polymerase specialized sigma24 family protein
MNRERNITQEDFDRLLAWLDADGPDGPDDRERAGQRYEAIRRRLIVIFTCRGCREAEDLADETINRVIIKLPEIADTYVGDPALYFYGVAQKVHLEYLRRRPPTHAIVTPLPAPNEEDDDEQEYECLEECIGRLPATSRELVIEYYTGEKKVKIERRKKLAERLGIALNALRIRAHRIRASLFKCVQNCIISQRGAAK